MWTEVEVTGSYVSTRSYDPRTSPESRLFLPKIAAMPTDFAALLNDFFGDIGGAPCQCPSKLDLNPEAP